MNWFFIILVVIMGIFLEGVLLKIPFVLIMLLLLVVFIQKPWVISLSIPIGLILDSVLFRTLGISSLFFAVMMGLAFAYGRKFEIQSIAFIIFSTVLSVTGYLLIFGYQNLILQLVLSMFVAVGGFFVIVLYNEKFSSSAKSYIH